VVEWITVLLQDPEVFQGEKVAFVSLSTGARQQEKDKAVLVCAVKEYTGIFEEQKTNFMCCNTDTTQTQPYQISNTQRTENKRPMW